MFLEQWESKMDLIVKRLRTIGVDRILYGSDGPPCRIGERFASFH